MAQDSAWILKMKNRLPSSNRLPTITAGEAATYDESNYTTKTRIRLDHFFLPNFLGYMTSRNCRTANGRVEYGGRP